MIMIYRVFSTEEELAEANGRWLYARATAPEYDRVMGIPSNPQLTLAWDYGRVMLDGRIACLVPKMWDVEFGGLELDLTEDDFVNIVVEEV
jgi:hypothetical protein